MTRAELIAKLLTSGHLNVPERQALGAPYVLLAEITATAASVLERNAYFPPNRRPFVSPAWEFPIIEKTKHATEDPESRWEYIVHIERDFPGYEHTQKTFDTLKAAIEQWLEWECFGREKALDGIPVLTDKPTQ